MNKQKIIDIEPGQVFKKTFTAGKYAQGEYTSLFLKLNDQRIVNLNTNTLCCGMDAQEEVEVLNHPLLSYATVGGLYEEV